MSIAQLTNTDSSRIHSALERRLGIDTRALAAFRIGLGLVLLTDLLLRARNLRMFYTDGGVLPVSLLAERAPTFARVSLHARSGEAWFQIALFSVALAFALALAIGYRTRIAGGVSLLLLLSLHARNPHVLSGGDALLQHLLFWSLFLPLGERWSIDARRRRTSRERIVTVAGAALLVQVLLVYGVNAVLKLRSDRWLSGDAVAFIFRLDQFTVLLGPPLRELPVVLEAANWAWLGLLVASPLLLVSAGRIRVALVCAFGAMHLGMLLTLSLGIFPLVSITALVPFLPDGVWDRLGRSLPAGRLRSAVTPPPASSSGTPPGRPSGHPSFGRWSTRIVRTAAAVVLVGLVVFNAIGLGFVPVPAPVDNTLPGTSPDPRWTMFAHPPTTDRWYVAPGETESGDRVDAFRRTALRWDRPDDITAVHSTARTRKYMSAMQHDEGLQSRFAAYLCERWNRNRNDTLRTVSVYAVGTPSHAVSDSPRERIELVNRSC